MSRWHLERAVYYLGLLGLAGEAAPEQDELPAKLAEIELKVRHSAPGSPPRPLDLDPEEREAVLAGDCAALYRHGVHPNAIRNYAGTFGFDYLESYRQAGLA